MTQTIYGVQVSPAFGRINALRDDQRDAAYIKARERIAGRKPTVEDFATHHESKYPREFVVLISGLAFFMLIVAFVPSAIRIHAIALQQFALVISDVTSQYVAAVCVVLMAETGQIAFSLASAVTDKRNQRRLYVVASLISTSIALMGNAYAAQEHAFTDAFAFLETFAPPVLTLITASVLKQQIVNAISERHIARDKFANALRLWSEASQNAELSAMWGRTLANTLRDAIRSANARSSAQLRELTSQDWYALVIREQGSEEWYDAEAKRVDEATQRLAIATAPMRSGEHSTDATGDIARLPTERTAIGQYTKTCAECGYVATGDTARSATNRLVAHQKKHANEAKRIAIALENDTRKENAR